jgi:hypothetical protein
MELSDEVQRTITRTASHESWTLLGKKVSKTETLFFSQIIIIYTVVIACIINLSLDNGKSTLWTALLSSCLGYLLPNPKIKKHG